MTQICKRFHFDSAHYLPCHEGRCKHLHGHRWVVEVKIDGPLQDTGPQRGMVIDFKEFDAIVKPIIDGLDHKVLNDIFLTDPTAEQISRWMYAKLDGVFTERFYGEVTVVYVRIYETPDCYAEVGVEDVR